MQINSFSQYIRQARDYNPVQQSENAANILPQLVIVLSFFPLMRRDADFNVTPVMNVKKPPLHYPIVI
ncbi:MAG: hypothetical protein CMI02_12035 [Oceanospirillaceae bacterium]|nr:hypothetical protein [Oceanospirillaceae bacterium]MBT12749.1 hypothetical protein [Oceanospirillaceae bacterium]|tara:strand:- start:427 stop:630 length:204 start_codon:yes stop_codon:yes gene_type:complete